MYIEYCNWLGPLIIIIIVVCMYISVVEGLRGSVEVFSHEVEGASPKDVMDLILLTQYFGK